MKRPPAGITKQSIRDELLLNVELVARDRERDDSNFSVLTLPGIEGVMNDLSFENQMLERYPGCHILGLEHDASTRFAMSCEMEIFDPRLTLLQMPADQYIKRSSGCYDVIFMDYCGAASRKIVKTWELMFNEYMFTQGAIFATTICTSARAAGVNKKVLGGNSAYHLSEKVKDLVKRSSYHKCKPLFSREYANREVSTRAQTMMVAAFVIS